VKISGWGRWLNGFYSEKRGYGNKIFGKHHVIGSQKSAAAVVWLVLHKMAVA
jgi:hypothetical protein